MDTSVRYRRSSRYLIATRNSYFLYSSQKQADCPCPAVPCILHRRSRAARFSGQGRVGKAGKSRPWAVPICRSIARRSIKAGSKGLRRADNHRVPPRNRRYMDRRALQSTNPIDKRFSQTPTYAFFEAIHIAPADEQRLRSRPRHALVTGLRITSPRPHLPISRSDVARAYDDWRHCSSEMITENPQTRPGRPHNGRSSKRRHLQKLCAGADRVQSIQPAHIRARAKIADRQIGP